MTWTVTVRRDDRVFSESLIDISDHVGTARGMLDATPPWVQPGDVVLADYTRRRGLRLRGPAVKAIESEEYLELRATGRACDHRRLDRHGDLTWYCPYEADPDETFCGDCYDAVRTALKVLPEMYVQLRLSLDTATGAAEKVSGTKSPPLPLNVQVEALIDDIEGTLTDQLDALCQQRGWAPPPLPGARGRRMGARAAWLLAHLPALVKSEAGADAGMELIDLARRGRQVLGLTNPPERKSVPCPECDAVALIRHMGSDTVACAACGRRYSGEEYDQAVAMNVAFHERDRKRA
jgi:ribosomal protein L37AE/L43A